MPLSSLGPPGNVLGTHGYPDLTHRHDDWLHISPRTSFKTGDPMRIRLVEQHEIHRKQEFCKWFLTIQLAAK